MSTPYEPAPPRRLPASRQTPATRRKTSAFAYLGDPSTTRRRAAEPEPAPAEMGRSGRGSDGATPRRRNSGWIRPSDVPEAAMAPAVGWVVGRTFDLQTQTTRAAVRTPAAVARAATRKIRTRRAQARQGVQPR